MMNIPGQLILALSLGWLIGSCQSESYGGVTSKFNVLIPKALNRPDGYNHRNAMFGNPPYGGSIQQQVYYTPSNLCNKSDLSQVKQPDWRSPYILMVDRGGCSFVQKVRNAQRAGAAAVLIADDICICGKPMCPLFPGGVIPETGETSLCESGEPLMTDDGSGSDIFIPSFLLFKHEVGPIRDSLLEGQPMRVQMSFSVPAPEKRVQYDLWTSPAVSRELHLDFSSAVQALQDHAIFTPHMYIHDGITAGCHGDKNLCPGLCSNAGRYCSVDQLDELQQEGGPMGADIVHESLRRICIWNVYGKDNGVGLPWWIYVQKFTQTCSSDRNSFLDPKCIDGAMKTAGVNVSAVEQCMQESGGTVGDTKNTLLDAELLDQTNARVFMMPSLYVNQAFIRGASNFQTTFAAICAGFSMDSEPPICKTCANCPSGEKACVERGSCSVSSSLWSTITAPDGVTEPSQQQQSVSWSTFAMAHGFLLLVFGTFGYVYYRRNKAYMQNETRTIVAEFIPGSSSRDDEERASLNFPFSLHEEEQDSDDSLHTVNSSNGFN